MEDDHVPEWESKLRLVVSAVEVIISIVAVLSGSYLVFKCWKSPRLAARGHALTIIVFLGLSVSVIEYAGLFSFGNNFRDFWWNYATAQCITFIMIPYLLKAYLLVFKYEISKYVTSLLLEKTQPADYQASIDAILQAKDKANWYTRNKWFVDSPWPSVFFFVVGGSMVMPSTKFALLINPHDSNPGFWFLACYMVCGFLFGIFLVFKLSNRQDDKWGIRKELKSNMIWFAALLSLYLINAFALHSIEQTHLLVYSLMWLCLLCCHLSVIYPLAQEWKLNQRKVRCVTSSTPQASRNERTRIRLKDYLANQQCHDAFQIHLQGEFSAENLSFWDTCEKFRELANKYRSGKSMEDFNSFVSMAIFIHDEFISESGASCVNLPYDIRNRVLRDYQTFASLNGVSQRIAAYKRKRSSRGRSSGSSDAKKKQQALVESLAPASPPDIEDQFLDMFNIAAHEILVMMEKDSFSRFRQTQDYEATVSIFRSTFLTLVAPAIPSRRSSRHLLPSPASSPGDSLNLETPNSPSQSRDRAVSQDTMVLQSLSKW